MIPRSLLAATGLALALAAGSAPAARAQSVPAAPKPPVKWSLVCAGDECKARIRLPIDTGSGELEMWVAKAGPKNEYLGVLTPLGIHLPSGVLLTFDRGKSAYAKLNLLDCKPVGCRAVIALGGKLEDRLRRSAEVGVVVRDSQTRSIVGLLLTLDGFGKSLDELRGRDAVVTSAADVPPAASKTPPRKAGGKTRPRPEAPPRP